MLRIIHISDTQLGFTDTLNRSRAAHASGVPVDEIDVEYTDIDKEAYKCAATRIHELKPAPDVVINTGDLVDDADSGVQWADYQTVTDAIRYPVYECLGNHDCTRDGSGHLRNYSNKPDCFIASVSSTEFLFINSQYLKDGSCNADFAREQRVFLESALAKPTDARQRVLVMHHPIYFESPDEDESYFCLPQPARQWILPLLDHFRVVLTGHYHRNHISRHMNTDLITTGPVSEAMGRNSDGSESKRGFRIIDLDEDSGELSHVYQQLD